MTSPTPDPTMTAISEAVTAGRSGNTAAARRKLLDLWTEIGVGGDPLHRCTLAHYLADLYDDPAESLAWDIRALDAADAVTEQRAQAHHATLHIAGFYPSLHLNLADNYRRLAAFPTAAQHIATARNHIADLPEGPYGDTIRTAIDQVAEAITQQNTTNRPSAP